MDRFLDAIAIIIIGALWLWVIALVIWAFYTMPALGIVVGIIAALYLICWAIARLTTRASRKYKREGNK